MMHAFRPGLLCGFIMLGSGLALAAGVPCGGTSKVWAGSYSPCVGDTVEIFALVKDCYDNVLPNKSTTFYSTRGATDTIIGPETVTDKSGIARAKITSLAPGACRVYAVVTGVQLWSSPEMAWSGASWCEAATWGSIKSLYR